MSIRWVAAVFILCAGSGGLFGSPAARAQSNYLVPVTPDPPNVPKGLNNSGEVLLDSGLYSYGTFITSFPSGFSGYAINARGDVAGLNAAGAALYKNGEVTNLQGLSAIYINAINTSDQIVGTTNIDNGSSYTAFFYSAGVVTIIDGPSGSGTTGSAAASGINDSGVITGCSYTHDGHNEAYTWANGALTDLGPGCGNAINARGEVTGDAYVGSDPNPHAFIYSNGGMKLLAEPAPFNGSEGIAINGGGQIIGNLRTGSSFVPFFYNGVMTDVNLLIPSSDPLKQSATIISTIAINDNRLMFLYGQLSGIGQLFLLQAPWLDVTPGPLTFDQAPASVSAPQVVTLTNSGTVPLPLDSISIASNGADFQQSNACPSSLPAAGECMVSVTFAPTVTGDDASSLDVVTGGATIRVPLSGSAQVSITMTVSPSQPTAGKPFAISWTATPGSSCQSSGGAPGDGWMATAPTGSVSVTETAAGNFVYQLTCTGGSLSKKSQLSVAVASAPTSGGGGIGLWELFVLSSVLAQRTWRRRDMRPTR